MSIEERAEAYASQFLKSRTYTRSAKNAYIAGFTQSEARIKELEEALKDLLFHYPYEGQSDKQKEVESKAAKALNK